jgi:hypothetical protein
MPGGDDDVNGRRDDLLEGLAVSVAILLRQSAPKAADGLAGLAGDFKTARQKHDEICAEIAAEFERG